MRDALLNIEKNVFFFLLCFTPNILNGEYIFFYFVSCLPAFQYYMTPWVGIGGIVLVVGREWENCMALSLYEPEVTLSLFLFVSCPVRGCGTPFSFTSLSYCISVSSLVSAARRAEL